MKLVFDERALAELEGIFDWISLESPATAKTVLDRLFSSIELLITFPFMGHAVGDTGALEWVVPRLPYIVAYQVDPANDRIVVPQCFTPHGTATARSEMRYAGVGAPRRA